ncbi:GntR family transcriptional regulator [Xylocopilactobacillus apicola]|uniref:GntR family transcriptional regulator n=1 Tax=Xylocopilactobacillus apicola TaxID=2932184 RepID=A0AAU9DQ71_9LACO|nr:GntR family transcriptional regulator [Xylocopilactobacillus apicola]BDR58009.1 GntR family transcriptional regulator [Xylocopilactobacillus apicola]
MPKYLEIEKVLRSRIQKGIYPPGAILPKQEQLAKEFHTSRITIRKALDYLIKMGLIYTQRGAGTFVRSNAQETSQVNTDINQYVGTTELLGQNHQIESRIINFEIRYATGSEQESLSLINHDLVYDIKRLRIVDNFPHALEYTIMPVKVIPGIDESILQKSIYSYIEDHLNQKIGPAFRKVSAAKPSADDQLYLKCAMDDPILKMEQIVSLENNVPFELSETHHRYDHEKILVYLPGNGR